MFERLHPVVWVIGATRSCKTAIAENGIAPLGFDLISTGDYYRLHYGMPDTFDRAFVFNLSAKAADMLTENHRCHHDHLAKLLSVADGPCVIEGQRNPFEFAKLYDPDKDMVFLIHREDVDIYDTAIERGLKAIEEMVRWNVNAGITHRESVTRITFGLDEIKAERLGVDNGEDEIILHGAVPPRRNDGSVEDRYPWINIVIGLIREHIRGYYGDSVGNAQQRAANAPSVSGP